MDMVMNAWHRCYAGIVFKKILKRILRQDKYCTLSENEKIQNSCHYEDSIALI